MLKRIPPTLNIDVSIDKITLALRALLMAVLLLSVLHNTQAQYGTTKGLILLSGEVKRADGAPMADVHVYNQHNGQVTISDASGFFTMYVSRTHVLTFSSVGYEPFYFSLPGGYKKDVYFAGIEMRKKVTPLPGVTIFGDKEEVQSILARDNPPNPLAEMQLGTQQGEQHAVEPTLANPVSLLWEWFSREGKEKRKLKQILERDELLEKINERFEGELIWELTGLYGTELDRFKNYCQLSDSFILNASEYEFLIAVKNCYYAYKTQQP